MEAKLTLRPSFSSITVHSLTPSEVGLALGYVLGIVQTLAWLVRQVAEVENDLTSAERVSSSALPRRVDLSSPFLPALHQILHYANELELEAAHEVLDTTPPKEWPQSGKIVFEK